MRKHLPTQDTPVIHATYLRLLCMGARAQGLDVETCLQTAGLPNWKTVLTTDAYFSQRQASVLVGAVTQAYATPWIGLPIGEMAQVSAHGPLGIATVAGKDLKQALQTIERFGSTRNAALRFRLQLGTKVAIFEINELVDHGPARVFIMCVLFATVLRLMEAVVGHRLERVEVDLPFAQPAWRKELDRFSNCKFRFDAGRLAFRLPSELLLSPCVSTDARAYAQAVQACETQLFADANMHLSSRVEELLDAGVDAHTTPSLPDVAGHLSVSQRTLIRHLEREGTSYQKLLDRVRKRKAAWYLEHSEYKVEDIAQRLGFVDTSNFSRTLRRWFGTTPGQLRLKLRSATAPAQIATISKSDFA